MSRANVQDSTFPGSIVIEGVLCYTGEDPGVWFYVPSVPAPEVAGGKPTVQLWASPASGVLQLGAEWTVSADVLARLEAGVKDATGRKAVRLEPAPAALLRVSLEIADDRGTLSVVAVSPSSGFPPYRAIFRAELNAAATAAAVAALNGRSGRVLVRYHVAVPLKASVRVQVEGDVEAAETSLRPGASAAEVREWVDQAIAARQVVITATASGPADDNLGERARELALAEFVRLLAAGLEQPGPGSGHTVTLKAVSTASDVVQRDVERVGDVSTWFQAGEGAAHVTVVPGPGGGEPVPPSGQRITVALGFAASELPVAFVEVRCRDRKVVLKPPRFEPGILDSSGCAGGLTVTTHFTNGSEPFRSVVAIADAARIAPAALGLTEFAVDGRERQAAGAREVRVRLQVSASRPPLSEDRTFYLRGEVWTASFVVVGRGEPIHAECQLDWKETTRDGQVRRHRSTVAGHQPVFVLRETEPESGVTP